ncbi:HIV Tat-specific factor 1-like protein [Dinothrombium tinctorium]|uniref:17S U2 SnRNP complex component HTATSF1 n=1 Tax=Dinothrombium tinctorium TaxID=1965070 RepID=A0A3S3S723_9ACAR|nr:HIV Tat-specific factor 1-like protein [Dinothrombium tinctorium]
MDDDFERQLRLEAEERLKKQSAASSAETSNPAVYTDPNDGTIYEWDYERKAWFPKLDDLFIAKYQENYAFNQQETQQSVVPNSNHSSSVPSPITAPTSKQQESTEDHEIAKSGKNKRKATSGENSRKANEVGWFEVDDEHNTNVYVSNLPLDITEEEFVEVMKKCGLLMKDDSGNFKVKLYRDSEGNLKGDALCTYIKVESVDLALQILDGYDVRGKKIKVERAKFTLKGEYDPNKKPKRAKKDKQKMKKRIEKLFDWRPDKLPSERSKCEKTIIIKNMFDVAEFLKDPKLILDYKDDLKEECTEKCGEVKKVEIYDRNPEGVASVTFENFDSADLCVSLMNGRFFAGRQLSAAHWDGKTKYQTKETEEEAEERIKQWDQYLEQATD